MILQCTCKHDAQDKLNGKGMRVHNPTKQQQGAKTVYRCTVCKNEKAA